MDNHEKTVQTYIQQGMSYLKKLRNYNRKNRQFQDTIDQVASAIRYLEQTILVQLRHADIADDLITRYEKVIAGYENAIDVLKRDNPEAWQGIQKMLPPERYT